MFNQIGHKIIAVFGLVTGGAMLIMIGFFTYNQESSILSHNQRTMSKLTESVIEGLQTVMLAGYADIAHSYAERLKTVPEIVDFVIMRTNGKEAFLDNNTIINVNNRLGDEAFDPRDLPGIHQILPSNDLNLQEVLKQKKQISYYETDAKNQKLLTFLTPIINNKDCQRCHGSANPVRGVLKLTTSMLPIEEDISRTRYQSLIMLLVLLVVVFIVTSFLIRRSVVRPIDRVTRAMAEVTKGDLNQQVPVLGHDELSRMAHSFNHMSKQVLSTYDGLRSEQDKLNTILLSSLEGIVVTDNKGDIVLVNQAAEALLGKDRASIEAGGFLNLLDIPI